MYVSGVLTTIRSALVNRSREAIVSALMSTASAGRTTSFGSPIDPEVLIASASRRGLEASVTLLRAVAGRSPSTASGVVRRRSGRRSDVSSPTFASLARSRRMTGVFPVLHAARTPRRIASGSDCLMRTRPGRPRSPSGPPDPAISAASASAIPAREAKEKPVPRHTTAVRSGATSTRSMNRCQITDRSPWRSRLPTRSGVDGCFPVTCGGPRRSAACKPRARPGSTNPRRGRPQRGRPARSRS